MKKGGGRRKDLRKELLKDRIEGRGGKKRESVGIKCKVGRGKKRNYGDKSVNMHVLNL